MKEVQDWYEVVRGRIEKHFGEGTGYLLQDFYLPKQAEIFRWRVELECGCIVEAMTKGEDAPPTKGQMCVRHLSAYRPIEEWQERREREYPPDTADPVLEVLSPEEGPGSARLSRTLSPFGRSLRAVVM